MSSHLQNDLPAERSRAGASARKKQERAADLAIAELQRHLLPAELPEVPGYEFAVSYRPCEVAGGDFYAFQPFADGRLGIVLADIAGHGAPAAVMMAALRGALAAFRVLGRPRETAPQEINAMVYEIGVPGMFITAFFVSLDPATGTLYCGNCGHPPAVIVRADGRSEVVIAAGDVPLGILPAVDPPMLRIALEPGDTFVVYTDGVTDSKDPSGRELGDGRVADLLARASRTSALQVCDEITRAILHHEGGGHPSDDQCVIVCRRVGCSTVPHLKSTSTTLRPITPFDRPQIACG
jgi:serine phosphatase RsbU (regulator of sigma subunit)